jgi:hypothetical protein
MNCERFVDDPPPDAKKSLGGVFMLRGPPAADRPMPVLLHQPHSKFLADVISVRALGEF